MKMLEKNNYFSLYDQTMEAIEQKKRFFNENMMKYENSLEAKQNFYIKTISRIFPQISDIRKDYSLTNSQLSSIYCSQNAKENIKKSLLKVIPYPSSGEQSITQNNFKPSYRWICKYIMDSTLFSIDQCVPRRVNNGPPSDWGSVRKLLFCNIDCKIWGQGDKQRLQVSLLDILSKYRVPKVVNIKFRYFKSMPSMIVKFKEEVGAAFTYYHFHQLSYLYLKVLGRRTEVFRMLNEVEATSKRIILVIREISEFVVHDQIVKLFQKKGINSFWIEELVEISGYQYTLCKLQQFDKVEKVFKTLDERFSLKKLKLNFHPKSIKMSEEKIEARILNKIEIQRMIIQY